MRSPAQIEAAKKNLANGKATRITKANAAENGRKGGRASGKSKRERRTMREGLEHLLQLPWFKENDAPIHEITSFVEALNSATNMTVQDKVLVAMIAAAIKGNVRAAEYIRDTIGQTVLPDKTAGQLTEYEDDGFTEAIKASAVDVWGERHGRKKKTANKAGRKVQPVQPEADAAADVVGGEVAVPKA